MMRNETCIYHLEKKDTRLFNKEHVIPKSFGSFTPNNLTLINTVCADCNDFFSKDLELFLGRDSIEGVLRYNLGLSEIPDKTIEKFKHRRITFQIDEEGDWKGVYLELIPPLNKSKTSPDVLVLPQVVFFKKNSEEKINFLIDQIKSKKELIKLGVDLKRGCFIYANSDEDESKIKVKLQEAGIDLEKLQYQIPDSSTLKAGQKIKVLIQSRIDQVILRSIAKISFNYLARTAGKSFVLSSSFNEIREYIRYAKKKEDRLVRISNRPILTPDSSKFKTNGHLVVVEWGDNYNMRILGKVSLFNRLTYIITLCNFFKGIIIDITAGHLFDIQSRKVSKLGHFQYFS